MILNDYNKLIRENFDISDTKTRRTIIALEDAEQSQLLTALTSALYDKIVEKVDKIDFGTIPRSRGDITKVEGFEKTLECLNIMRQIVMEYKENPDIVDTVLSAIENIRNRKATFVKAYSMNIEFPIVLYNTVVLSIEQCVSFLIAVCIQYIKDPATQDMKAALDKVSYSNTRDNLLYEQLVSFNKLCVSKEIDSILDDIIKKGGKLAEDASIVINVKGDVDVDVKKFGSPFKKYDCDDDDDKDEKEPCDGIEVPSCDTVPVNGDCASGSYPEPVEEGLGLIIGLGALGAVGAGFALKGASILIKAVIPMLRNMVYFVYNVRTKLSDTMAVQAQFIEANAYRLMYSTDSNLTDEKRKKVVDKQLRIAEKLKNIANKIAINSNKAEKETQVMSAEDEKKKKIDDLKDQLPDDGGIF